VAFRDLDGEAREIPTIAARTHERAHALARREQSAHDRSAEEAVRAGHELRPAHAGCPAVPPNALSHAGSTISVNAMLTQRPVASSMPMLAVPTCGENARLPKLATVVSALASTARMVLVSNSSVACSARNRCTT